MNDLISRKDVLKLVSAVSGDVSMDTDERIKLYAEICSLPSAEAKTKCIAQINVDTEEVVRRIKEEYDIHDVEVVRCKDCIHWFPQTQCGFDEDNDEYHDYCGLLIPDDDYYAFRRKADDYCSYGVRKESTE